MHVGCGVGDRAQARRLEGHEAGCAAWHRAAAAVTTGQADIVKAVVGEAPADVAQDASRLADEQAEPGHLGGPERLRVAFDPGIEPGRRRDERAHVGGERLENGRLRGARLLRECGADPSGEVGVLAEPAQGFRPITAHLLGLLDRHSHLRFQRRRAPIPEKLLAPGQVPQRGRVAPQGRSRDRPRAPAPVREVPFGPMTTGARALAVAGKARVDEEPRPQRDLVGSERIVGRRRWWQPRPLEPFLPERFDVAALGLERRRPARQQQAQQRDDGDGARTGVPARHALSPVPPAD